MRRPLEPRVAGGGETGSRVFNDLLQEGVFVEADAPRLPAGLPERRGGGEEDQDGDEGARRHDATSTFSRTSVLENACSGGLAMPALKAMGLQERLMQLAARRP